MTDSPLTSLTVILAFALAGVWFQRHGRWSLFFQGLTGQLVINNARGTPGPPAPPSNTAPNRAGPSQPVTSINAAAPNQQGYPLPAQTGIPGTPTINNENPPPIF